MLLPSSDIQSDQRGQLSQPLDPIRCSLPTNIAAFHAIAKVFVGHLAERLDHMQQSFADQDWPALAQHAHWVKGSAGTAGFKAFTAPAQALLTAIGQPGDDQDVPEIEMHLQELFSLRDRIDHEFSSPEETS